MCLEAPGKEYIKHLTLLHGVNKSHCRKQKQHKVGLFTPVVLQRIFYRMFHIMLCVVVDDDGPDNPGRQDDRSRSDYRGAPTGR